MFRYFLILFAILALASVALADPPAGKGKRGRDKGQTEQEEGFRPSGYAHFSPNERAVIVDYYRHYPGGGETASLPPGIQKKVARGKPLPPGIAKKLPDDLRRRLPARAGYDYRVVDGDVMLVELATGLIADVIYRSMP